MGQANNHFDLLASGYDVGVNLPEVECTRLRASMVGTTGPISYQPKQACPGEFDVGQAILKPNG